MYSDGSSVPWFDDFVGIAYRYYDLRMNVVPLFVDRKEAASIWHDTIHPWVDPSIKIRFLEIDDKYWFIMGSESKNNETNLITNSTLTKTFLIFTEKTEYKNLNKSSNDYEKYEAKARLNLINKIYKSYDDSVNQKYKVELNQRTIERVKNSF